eukprot:12627891-Alexandrium_andersonii.AAC.1
MCRELELLHLREFLQRGPQRAPRAASEGEQAAAQRLEAAEVGEHLPIPPIGLRWDPLDRWAE